MSKECNHNCRQGRSCSCSHPSQYDPSPVILLVVAIYLMVSLAWHFVTFF